MVGYFYAVVATFLFITGDYFVKLAADRVAGLVSVPMAIGAALYAASAVMIYLTLRHMSLAQFGVALSILSVIALAAMGVLLFGEKLYLREYLGLGLAVASLLLMARAT